MLNKIFDPASIAIIGASNKKNSVGLSLYKNALDSAKKRKVYAVNIKGKTILGQKSFKNIKDIKKPVDVAVIATPSRSVPQVMRDCVEAGIRNVVIITAGFSEVGKEGKKLFAQIKEISHSSKIRVLGPNCLGLINPQRDLNLSFASKQASKGGVALASQSGAICTALLDWAEKEKVGFSSFVSLGSMLDIGFAQLIEYFNKDKNTKSIVLYMESVNDPQEFIRVCRSSKKSIFVLKSGRSKAGASAAKSHTGSLAGSDKIFDAMFRQAGVSRLDTLQEMQDLILFENSQASIKKGELAIISNAGGPGVICADYLDSLDFPLIKIKKDTKEKLDKVLPATWSKANPIDIIGDASPERFERALKVCLAAKEIDAVFLLLTPQAMTDAESLAKSLLAQKIPRSKMVFASFVGGTEVLKARKILQEAGFLIFDTPERALLAFVGHVKQKRSIKERAQDYQYPEIKAKKNKVAVIIARALLAKKKSLNEAEVKDLLAAYGLPVLKYQVAESEKEAMQKFKSFKNAIAMKILSSDILHKVDVGGVKLSVSKAGDVGKAYRAIMSDVKKRAKKARIEGVIMEPMIKTDLELIVGLSYDPVLGPNLMFGRGGSEVELLADVSFGVLPLSTQEIKSMIKETLVSKRLSGFRGMKEVNIEKITDLIYKISQLAQDFPEIKELDINPLSVSDGDLYVLDAKVVLQ